VYIILYEYICFNSILFQRFTYTTINFNNNNKIKELLLNNVISAWIEYDARDGVFLLLKNIYWVLYLILYPSQ